jgi:glycosyltransferase involved in cell wall biosynthesis
MRETLSPTLIIYRDLLLSSSETFVIAQGNSIEHYKPYYVGSRLIPGLSPPTGQTLVVNRNWLGKVPEALFKIWGVAPNFVRKLKTLHPALIHAHFGMDGVLALPLARALKIPLIVTFHGYDATVKDEYARHSFYVHRKYLRNRDRLKREAALFIAVSEFIKSKLIALKFPPEKIIVHYIGIDIVKFKPDPAVKRNASVLFVGRLVENKGCEYLIRAMAQVQKAIPRTELIVIGDGPLRRSLESLSRELLTKYSFLGFQSVANVKLLMNHSKLLSVPSVTVDSGAAEGFGMVFAEAQAMGLPVVSFSTGGIPEAVAHGETGYLARERNVGQLAAYILELLKNEELWLKFSCNGQKRVSKMFNLHKQSEGLEKIYNLVLEKELRGG